MKFIVRRDPAGYFKYGASQSPTAAALLAPYGIGRETARSIVLIEAGQVYLRSMASLRIARRLPFPWSLSGELLVVPRPLREAFLHEDLRVGRFGPPFSSPQEPHCRDEVEGSSHVSDEVPRGELVGRMGCNFQKEAGERWVGSTGRRFMQPPRTAC